MTQAIPAGERLLEVPSEPPEAARRDAGVFWSVPVDDVFADLHAPPSGLTEEEAAQRLARYGPNRVGGMPRLEGLRLFAAQFKSPVTLLLAGAAILSLLLGETTDGFIILGIVFTSSGLGFWQEHHASGAVARLMAQLRTQVAVTRDGQLRDVPIDDVVPGDVVVLTAGSSVPGDARLLTANHLYVDESALSGESFPAEKTPGVVPAEAPLTERTNTLFLGTHVISGTATAVVVHTGAKTFFGAVSASLAHHPPETAFEHGIRRFGYLLLEIALVLALAIFAINVALERPVLDALLFTLALTVGLTPQLLPAIVSVTLAQGARRMAARHVIVRRLAAIEDIGGMTVLCTDKTGTLTEGVVCVAAALDPEGQPSAAVLRSARLNAAFASGFTNPIDEALRHGEPLAVAGYEKVGEVPYDFVRRRVSVAVRGPEGCVLITKGAVAEVLDVCRLVADGDAPPRPIEDARAQIETLFETQSRAGYRCLGVAYRPIEREPVAGPEEERAMVFLGLILFSDPPKPGVADDLRAMNDLGVALKLVTGDNRYVAGRVARDLGFGTSVVTAEEVRCTSDAALGQVVQRADVFAELDPNQKERVILALQKQGHAVGYLGDGINDAAALHAADVGISVDTAVDVTKQAADVVLIEKDLGVLVEGVRAGRGAFANTLKYVFITASANFGNMFSMAGASLVAPFLPMLPKQILLLNVLSDLPAMTIATDRLDDELVARPRRWEMRAIRRFMITFGLVSSLFDYLTFGVLLSLHVPVATFRTAWFTESLLSELLILLVIRTRRPFYRSVPGRGLLVASVIVGAAVLLLPYTPAAGVLGLRALPASLLLMVGAILIAYVAASEAVKHRFFRAGTL